MVEQEQSHLIGYSLLALSLILIVFKLSTCSSEEYSEKSKTYSICECEDAYRALMYGEGNHAVNKYTGEKYTTLDANGNGYIDIIDECAVLYSNGGKPLNDGGFSKYPAYQDCITKNNEPLNKDTPDTIVAKWDLEKFHIYQRDALGTYLYDEPWNPKGFVLVFTGHVQDEYGKISEKRVVQGHYKVSKRFQKEAKQYSNANFYKYGNASNDKLGGYAPFVKCFEGHNFDNDKFCDCSYLMPD